jgi:hypothetical protein
MKDEHAQRDLIDHKYRSCHVASQERRVAHLCSRHSTLLPMAIFLLCGGAYGRIVCVYRHEADEAARNSGVARCDAVGVPSRISRTIAAA